MRIIFVSNNYTPYSGGVVSSIDATIDELQKQGHEVLLITLNFLGKHDDPLWVRRIPSLIRFRCKHNYMAIPWRPKFYVKKWIQEFKPNVVHVHHPFLLGPIAVRIARQRGIKTVFTYHTIYEAYAHNVPLPQFITKPIITTLVLSFCKQVDHIIVPSSSMQQYLQEQYITHVSVIPSGLRSLFLNQLCIAKKLQKPYQLLYVGRFTKEKNIPLLLDVLAKLPDAYQCTLVGYGAYTDYLKQYAYEILQLSPQKVAFVIKPDEQKLLEYYRNAHLFLFPSQTDTQGLVLAEAMACSTPVVALEGPGQKDIICHAQNGFIVHDALEMQKTIQMIFTDTARYKMLQKKAYEKANTYTPIVCVTKIVEIYQKVILL